VRVGAESMNYKQERKHIHAEPDRHGNRRVYFRVGHGPRIRIWEPEGSEEFDRRYHELLRKHAAGELKPPPSTAPTPDTLRWLGCKWLASADYQQRDPRTQRVTQLILEGIYDERIAVGSSLLFGDCPLKRFTATSVGILRDRKASVPEGANNRIRRLRAMFKYALLPENRHLGVTSNPTLGVDFLKPKRAGGFPTWEPEHLDLYEACHAKGTRARLAYDLLKYVGCRRSDVVKIGRQHTRNGRLRFTAHKGRNKTPVTIDMLILGEFAEALAAAPANNLHFLVTAHGKPFTAAGFGNWFRECCDEAGLPGLSAHGLRKAAATRAAEDGLTAHELMAKFGWLTLAQAEHYTRAAQRRLLADSGERKIRTNRVEESLTPAPHLPQVRESAAKKRG